MLFHFTCVILFLFLDWMNVTLRISVKMLLHVNSLSICQHTIKCSCLQRSYLQPYLLEQSHSASTKRTMWTRYEENDFKMFLFTKILV